MTGRAITLLPASRAQGTDRRCGGDLLCHPLMRPCLVEIGDVRLEDALELLLLKDQQVVQTCLPHTPQKTLADGIGSWGMNGGFEHTDATRGRHAGKARPEFAVVITKQILRCLPIGRRFPKLLRYPGIGRRACHADMDHSSRLQAGVEEGEERSKEQIAHQKARRMPRCGQRGCAERSATSDLVAAVSKRASGTSGSSACIHRCPVSGVLPACVQLPRVDSLSPSA